MGRVEGSYKYCHLISDPSINPVPSATVNKGVFLQLGSCGECLVRERRVDMVEERERIRPRCLSDRCPDGGFFDIGGGFIVAGEKAHAVVRSHGSDKELREKRFDGSVRGDGEVCRIVLRTFNAR